MSDIIYGRNAVREALNSNQTINRIIIATGNLGFNIKNIIDTAKEKCIVIDRADVKVMNKIAKGERHQGVIAYVAPIVYKTMDDVLELAKTRGGPPFVLLLDEITDPHNLGAIIRSAEVLGAHGVLLPKRRSAPVNAVVLKTSAGAANFLPIVQIGNAVQTVEALKEQGFWIIGADMSGGDFESVDLNLPVVLVIGSEGKGIGRLLKEKVDYLVKIPMKGHVSSLNASVAAGILIYEIVRRRNYGKG